MGVFAYPVLRHYNRRMGSLPPATAPAPQALPPHPHLSRYYDGDRERFVRGIFDSAAPDYDRIERLMAWGSGSRYRHEALLRAGLRRGMKTLDVAVGTGLVAREAVAITCGGVIGIDPSAGMLRHARQSLDIGAVMGIAERLPLDRSTFDFLSMGYALRHVSDLNLAFGEFFRVLRPGGTLCILELTPPENAAKRLLLRCYMGLWIPIAARFLARSASSQLLWRYYWDTIAACVPPERVTAALRQAGFADVNRHTEMGIFSEYTARKPDRP